MAGRQTKMLLPFRGKTMLGTVIDIVVNSGVGNTLVVLGKENRKITEIVNKLPVKYCYNYNYKEGMLSSVQSGFRNLPADFQAVLVFQGDQPLINPSTGSRLIEAYRASEKGIVVPIFMKKRGHPLLLDRKYKNEIIESFAPIPIYYAPLFETEVVGMTMLNRMAEEVFKGEDPVAIKYNGRAQTVDKEGEDYILAIDMPFMDKRDLSLNQKGDQLIIKAGSIKRNITLPRTLMDFSIKRAKFEEEKLKIWFGSDSNE
jgi:CTP:molybdopterin cytidylyltransferase MocA